MQCERCENTNPDDNLFCENCGTRIGESAPETAACSCGAPLSEMDAEGFCGGCGRRLKRPDSDHIEIELLPDFAGVSDRGLRHNSNEDRFALTHSGDTYALVVCDGVSMSQDADEAALSAVSAAAEAFREELANAEIDHTELVKNAVRRAALAVSALGKRRTEAPSTTLVAAVADRNTVTVAWIGDSRAYWITGTEAKQITRDHSWLNSPAAREAGSEAQKAANAHALTRWVGADSSDLEPEIVQRRLESSGLLLLCSDGLWNYADNPDELAALVTAADMPGASALSISRDLVEFARSKGGHDNITAAILRHQVSEDHVNGR